MNDHLDRVLFEWEYGDFFTIRNACEGVLITGGIGSGKTSGSGNLLAGHYLRNGFAGTVLTAKANEKDLWVKYCKKYGREDDLVIVSPTSGKTFNFMEYESSLRTDDGKGIADNIADVLLKVIKASDDGNAVSKDEFWIKSLEELIVCAVELALLTSNNRFEHIYEIVLSAPRTFEQSKNGDWQKSSKCYLAMKHVANYLDNQEETQYILEQERRLKNLENYFLGRWITLSERTRTSIEQMFFSFCSRFMRDPLYSIFNTTTNFVPEDVFEGKIILFDFPYLKYDKIGKEAQLLWKFIFQRSMLRRTITPKSRPVFLWVDEAHYFLHENDVQAQSTARDFRLCTVYITQNLPNFYLNFGGNSELGKIRFKALAGTLATKFFHANSDVETNEYASDLIGKDWLWSANEGQTMGEKISFSSGQTETLTHLVEPSTFTKLKTGSPLNNHEVQAIVHRQGKIFQSTDSSYKIVTLKQDSL
ncbi:MAG: TraM recognition domain-containing protein [Bacteroidota bacterium]